jgi:hypothetical protein
MKVPTFVLSIFGPEEESGMNAGASKPLPVTRFHAALFLGL